MISWVEEEHGIMSDKGLFKQFMLQKQSSFQKLKKLLILIAPTSIHIERFSGCISDWSVLNNDWSIEKFDLLTLIWGAYATVKYLTHEFPDLYKNVKLMAKV